MPSGVKLTVRDRLETAVARAAMALPDPVVRLLVGSPVVREGRTLDVQVQLILRALDLIGHPPAGGATLAAARREIDVSGNQLAPRNVNLAAVEDRVLGSTPVRLYRPHGVADPSPALVFFHGGGFAVGSLDSHDAMCRQMAAQVPCTVIAVDYRCAPEHPFPAAPDDALEAFRAVAQQAQALGLDPARLGICGDSAGGTLAAGVALDTRGDDVRPCLQVLIYPCLDLTLSFPSIDTLGTGFLLEKVGLAWFRDTYLGDHDPRDPRASPWWCADLSGAPPALVVTAGFDPLRDEGDAYAAKLAQHGVPVVHHSAAGMFHGFWNTSGCIRQARVAFDAGLEVVRAALVAGS
jgi:acetyl esterase